LGDILGEKPDMAFQVNGPDDVKTKEQIVAYLKVPTHTDIAPSPQ
jgi:hypothetical protein